MPSLLDQMKTIAEQGGLTSKFFVARLLTPIGPSYEQAVQRFQPYSQVVSANSQARADAVKIALRPIARKIPAFIIVNNRLGGHAPGTIAAIAESLLAQLNNPS